MKLIEQIIKNNFLNDDIFIILGLLIKIKIKKIKF